MKFFLFIILLLGIFISCSPIKSSPQGEKHQMELTLHEVQTNVDDARHDINSFQTELQILDGKIKHQENATASIKQQLVEKILASLENLSRHIHQMEKKMSHTEKKQEIVLKDLQNFSAHSKEVNNALTQYKSRINELEKEIFKQTYRLNDVAKLKGTLENIVHSMRQSSLEGIYLEKYKVKSGDSLEKIARRYKISVDALKKANNLNDDLIVIGQELKIPSSMKR